MPRYPRNYIKTTFFHIITQGINKSYIFENPEDIKYYIKIMCKLSEEYRIKLIAYCVMNNHTHMLLEVNELNNLIKYMQSINTRYGKYYNKKYNRVGYVFRDRYKSEGIYSEKHLYNCIRYIYDNPVKAGICNKAEEYPYSNYKKISEIYNEEYYRFIGDESDKICKKLINDFLKENNLGLNELKKDKNKLKQIISNLKNDYNISLRTVAKEINLGRETVRKIFKN